MTADFDQLIEDYIEQALPTFQEQLIELIKIPSISNDPDHKDDTYKILEAIGEIIKGYGFQTNIIETKGNPCFVATLETDPTKPWLMVYNHMDVQPAKEPQWVSEPFTPLVDNGKIIGRGSTDDKGPALTILHAINFLKENGFDMPNIQVVYETEEEIGSLNFGSFLDDNQALLKKPESILVSDTIFEGTSPAITYQLKGMQRADLELTTGTKDVHSGMIGGVVKNPLNILINALAKCVDQTGNILIPGFYDDIHPISEQEQQALEEVAEQMNYNKLKEDSGQASFYSDNPLDIIMRMWKKPTFEVHGFEGVQSGHGTKSSLPYSVKAKLSMRLVPGQVPEKIMKNLEDFIHSIDPDINIINKGGTRATVSPIDNIFMEKASRACEYGFGKKSLFVGCGGTIGSIPEFQRVYPETPIVLLAQSLMSDGYHAPNEHFQLSQARNGIKTMAKYMNSLI